MVGCSAVKPNSNSKKAGSSKQPILKPAAHGVCMTLNVYLANLYVFLH